MPKVTADVSEARSLAPIKPGDYELEAVSAEPGTLSANPGFESVSPNRSASGRLPLLRK